MNDQQIDQLLANAERHLASLDRPEENVQNILATILPIIESRIAQATQFTPALPGPPGRDGLVTPEEVRSVVQEEVAKIPVPKDGKPGKDGKDGKKVITLTRVPENRASAVEFTQSGTTVTRTAEDKLRDIISVKDFGAVGNGTADDTVAITSADAVGKAVFVPNGTYDTTLASTSLDGPYWGDGQIRDTNNRLRGKFFSAIKSAPSSLGDESTGIETAFNGDFSKALFPVEYRITGAATIGQPTTGYRYTPEATPHYTFLYNEAGHNNATDSNTGRTAATAYRTRVYQAGQGDCMAYNAAAFVTGTKASSTSFLANPAASLFTGDITAGADGVYLNPREIVIDGSTYDCAAVGDVIRMERNSAAGAKGAWWAGYRVQSEGTEEIDVGFSLQGPANIGIDFTWADFPGTGTYINAGATFKADQRIYMNATATDTTGLERFPSATGTDYFSYSSSLSAFHFVVGNASAFQIYSNQIISPNILRSNAAVLANGGTAIPAGGTAGAGLRVSSTSNFGVFFGSGEPTLAAAKGSLYLRSDGSSTSTRLYVNTDGSTTWTNVTTAS